MAAQILPQYGIGLGGKTVETAAHALRYHPLHRGHEPVPVHQQVEKRHRYQHRVADDGKSHAATDLQRSHEGAEHILKVGIQVLQHKRLDVVHVQRQLDAQLRQQGFEGFVQAVEQYGHLIPHQWQFLGQNGHDQQGYPERRNQHGKFYHQHRQQTRNSPAGHMVEPVHHRRQGIGQHRRHHKRGQNRRQHPHHQCHQKRQQGPGGSAFLGWGELHAGNRG